jgi:ribosomal protein S18 acetylase RimI-like enzyme
MLDAASLISGGFSQTFSGSGDAAVAANAEKQKYRKTTAPTLFMGRTMNIKAPTEKPDGEPILEFGEDNENAELAALLGEEIAARFGPRGEAPLAIVARDPAGGLIGGLNGVTHWRWLYVRHLWVAPAFRGQGIGAQLMRAAERKAVERNCVGLYVDTFDSGLSAFYRRCGFTAAGRIEDFPPGAARLYFSKKI